MKNTKITPYLVCLNFVFLSILTVFNSVYAQKTNGTVKSLVDTEDYFNNLAKKKGLNAAFIELASKDGVAFRPNPVNIKDYYSKEKLADFDLSWSPDYAMIAKSGYFGFTTGLYQLSLKADTIYGHYLSVWKAGSNKKWALELDAGISHKKPLNTASAQFIDPSNYKYTKLIGPKKIKMREDIVFSTDLLFGKALKNSGNKNFNEFYADDVRLYFPENLPIIGKIEAIKFIDKKNQHITSNPTFTDRAYSGDIAYTNGKATVGAKKYNYVRVWKTDENLKWNIIIDMYIPE